MKYIIYDFAQNTDDWYKIRIGKFTATNAYTIYKGGQGLNILIVQKLAEKLSNVLPVEINTPAMGWGHEQEEVAAELYSQETGAECSKVGFIEVGRYFGVSPDRVIFNKKGKIIKAVEIKCPQDTNFVKYILDILEKGEMGINPEHYAQMQAQMYAMNTKETDYVVYNPHFKKELFYINVKRSDEFISIFKTKLKNAIEDLKKKEKLLLKKNS